MIVIVVDRCGCGCVSVYRIGTWDCAAICDKASVFLCGCGRLDVGTTINNVRDTKTSLASNVRNTREYWK